MDCGPPAACLPLLNRYVPTPYPNRTIDPSNTGKFTRLLRSTLDENPHIRALMKAFHDRLSAFLEPYLTTPPKDGRPLTIVTWAQSLDAKIAPASRTPIALSSLETKYMTHLIRRQTDAILVGAETAVTDNPSLNGMNLCNEAECSASASEWLGRGMAGGGDGTSA